LMKSKLATLGFVLLAVALLLTACEQRAPTLTEWPIPTDKYVFIERWIEIYQDSVMSAFIDFPTYHFDQNSGELKPDIVPPGRWFPLEDLTELKVVYGRGTKRTGSAGAGINSQVFAVTGLPFTEPPKEDTDVVVTVERVNAQGVAYFRRGNEQIVLQPSESWTREGKSTIEWGEVKSEVLSRERISNFGVLDKSGIQTVLTINRHLRPRQLAEEEKAETRRIALSDPEVLKRIGDKEYEVTRIEEFSWSEGDEFFVFPAVELNIPPDRQVEGVVLWVCVDLEAKKVVEIHSTPRKPLPPNISIMNAAIRLIIYVLPILVVIAIPFFILWMIWRRWRRGRKAA